MHACRACCLRRAALPPTLLPQGAAAQAGGDERHAGRREVLKVLPRLPGVPCKSFFAAFLALRLCLCPLAPPLPCIRTADCECCNPGSWRELQRSRLSPAAPAASPPPAGAGAHLPRGGHPCAGGPHPGVPAGGVGGGCCWMGGGCTAGLWWDVLCCSRGSTRAGWLGCALPVELGGRCPTCTLQLHAAATYKTAPPSLPQAAVDTAMDIHCNQPQGDILLFLTGQAEIDKAVKQLNDAGGRICS